MKKILNYIKYILSVDRENFCNYKLINYLNSLNEKDKNDFIRKLYNLKTKL